METKEFKLREHRFQIDDLDKSDNIRSKAKSTITRILDDINSIGHVIDNLCKDDAKTGEFIVRYTVELDKVDEFDNKSKFLFA